ncbi:MAG: hypothetical protein Q8S58_07365 [Bosea sp. (in: a-proteobacteria)]|uniref:hypothetical protein n=1 Tax=Bosea sp. (in: a-proteobacteria) TaxID=1871050 RepID=UPI002732A286|nr:hypothetical protein [Bosea sp. (in: a-proteobacteria)]MDP3257344.1 hypothetical protein [Bosea sp. (in: a-proteobacteria)]MDP3318932.1 hypothetical protein [Bosea sp. (in: a-proteobacteria)]
MKHLALSLLLLLAAAPALAQSRPSTSDRSCAANRQSVAASGAIVLGTGGFTYDRFVRDRRFCEHGDYLEPAFVWSRDNPQCFIGYRCKVDLPWD